jgi:hypothetical protein
VIKGMKLWVIWILSLSVGIYGMGLVFNGITHGSLQNTLVGVPVLLLGIWVTGNILASAKQFRRRSKMSSLK